VKLFSISDGLMVVTVKTKVLVPVPLCSLQIQVEWPGIEPRPVY